MRRSGTVLLAIVFAALWSTSAGAVTKTVDATSSFTFDPTLVKIGQAAPSSGTTPRASRTPRHRTQG